MGGKTGVWILGLVILAAVVLAILRVAGQPWSWDFNHISLVFLLAVIFLAIVSWTVRWMRYGTEGVTQHWNTVGDGLTAEFNNKPKMRRYFVFWIVVLLALAIYSFMTQQH